MTSLVSVGRSVNVVYLGFSKVFRAASHSILYWVCVEVLIAGQLATRVASVRSTQKKQAEAAR